MSWRGEWSSQGPILSVRATGGFLIGWLAGVCCATLLVASLAVAEVSVSPGQSTPTPRATAPSQPLEPASSALPQGPALCSPREILALLDQRKQLLDQKEARLRAEAERLGILRQEVEKLIAQHEQEVAATAAAKEAARRERAKAEEEAREARLVQLTKIYETMAPEEAALRIEQLPRDLAVQVLSRLKSKTASAILAQVKPAKAAKLTEALVAHAEVSH